AHAAIHGHTGGLHDIHFDAALLQPARKPEAAPAGLVGDDDPLHRHAGRGRTTLVALDRGHERVGPGGELLLSCLVAERCWDQVRWAIEAYAWRFDGCAKPPRARRS